MKKKLLFSRIAALICCIAMCAAFIIPFATTAAEGDAIVNIVTNATLYDENTEIVTLTQFTTQVGTPRTFFVEVNEKPTIAVTPSAMKCQVKLNEEYTGVWAITITPKVAGAHTVNITVATPVTVTAPTGDGFTYTALSKPVYGESFGFYITPKDGYSKPTGVYAKVSETKTAITEVSTNYYVIPELTESVEIVVEGVTSNSYTVSALSGNYTVNGLADSYNYGVEAEFTITAKPGYEVTSVIVNMSGETAILTAKDGKYTIPKVTGNAVVTVNTQKVNSTIKYANSVSNVYTVVPGAVNAEYGSTVTFQVIPAEGYKAPTVKMTSGEQTTVLTPNGNQYTFTMPAGNVDIAVEDSGKYTYSVTIPANVTAEGNVDLSKVEYGTNVTLVTNFDATYDESTIVVTVNGTPVSKNSDGKYVITVTENTVVTATAQKKTYTVTLVDGTGYTLTTTENTRVTAGDTFRFKLNVAAGYTGVTVVATGNDNNLSGPDANGYYTLVVNGDVTVSANGAQLETISIPEVVVSGAKVDGGSVSYGGNYQFKVKKDDGYRVTSVIVNGTTLAEVNGKYTVYGVTATPTIVVNTVKNVLTVNYQGDDKHTVDIPASTFDYENAGQALGATVAANCAVHSFEGWNMTADELKALIADNDATVTLTAQFAVDAAKLANIVSLSKVTVDDQDINGSKKITIKATVTVNSSDDACFNEVALTGFGGIVYLNGYDSDTDVENAIITGKSGFIDDANNIVVFVGSNSELTIENANGNNIYITVTVPAAVHASIDHTANWVEITVDGTSAVAIG